MPVVTAAGDSAGEATLTLKAGKNPEVYGHIVRAAAPPEGYSRGKVDSIL